MSNQHIHRVGIVGARGYVGAQLIKLIIEHPNFEISFAASRSQIGEPIPGIDGQYFCDADPDSISQLDAEAVILAVPDGATKEYTQRLKGKVVLDLSSDHRFDDQWVYGLSELNTKNIIGSTRISNPGCYATALQLAASPLVSMLDGPIHAFGVSGYSGAGTTPTDRNNIDLLEGGITPYALVDHTHERESTRHLNHPVRFSPHVAPYFRGITMTVQARTHTDTDIESFTQLYHDAYDQSEQIEFIGAGIPRVQDIAHQTGAQIGGICVGKDQRSVSVVCVIDNLLKGAASQAIQNLNLALGYPINTGLLQEVPV